MMALSFYTVFPAGAKSLSETTNQIAAYTLHHHQYITTEYMHTLHQHLYLNARQN